MFISRQESTDPIDRAIIKEMHRYARPLYAGSLLAASLAYRYYAVSWVSIPAAGLALILAVAGCSVYMHNPAPTKKSVERFKYTAFDLMRNGIAVTSPITMLVMVIFAEALPSTA